MKNKKSLISTILLCVGLLLAVCSIFSFFGSAMKLSTESQAVIYSSVFTFMFGGNVTITAGGQVYPDIQPIKSAPMLTIVFAIEILVILLAIIIAVGYFTKKLDTKKIMILTCVCSVLMLVGAILALASKNSMVKSFGEETDDIIIKLGAGLIAYIVLNFVGVATNVASVVIHKKSV